MENKYKYKSLVHYILMVNILILGNGARERAIEERLCTEDERNTIFKLNIGFTTEDFECIKNFCEGENVELVIPSTEMYLCSGITNYLTRHLPNIKVFGPNKYQAKIEGSKIFSKNLMTELQLPTPDYKYFKTYTNVFYDSYSGISPTSTEKFPVIKYSGLAKGKGVYISNTISEFSRNLIDVFKKGDDGILLESHITGTEVSILAFCNGKEAFLMPQAQDYKQIYDNDEGPNTGGMGIICPANILNQDELIKIKRHMDKVVERLNYKGILYAGLMKTRNNIYFLEFNCRFGDPEAQAILNLLDSETHLTDIMLTCVEGNKPIIKWSDKYVAGVILSHEDYPISSLDEPVKMTYADNINYNAVKIYESGVINIENNKYTKGGRVLTMISKARNLAVALENIYNNINKITFDGAYYRRDIGKNNKKVQSNNKLAIGILASGRWNKYNPSFRTACRFCKSNNNKSKRVSYYRKGKKI